MWDNLKRDWGNWCPFLELLLLGCNQHPFYNPDGKVKRAGWVLAIQRQFSDELS